jgi:hypothetical protein
VPPPADIPTVTAPLTVAPAAGLVNAAVTAAPPFCTVMLCVAVAVPDALSVTVSPSVCGPLAAVVEFHEKEASVLVVVVKIWAPSTVRR